MISGREIQPVVGKVKAIQEAPAPTYYYHRFLPIMATILEPQHELLRQSTPWKWGREQQQAFKGARGLLQSADVLIHFLSHQLPHGSEKLIGYASRSLNSAERNYSTIEKETLAIIFEVKKFHQFLYGHAFTINTDHELLESLLSATKAVPLFADPRAQRWALTLAVYEYNIHYKAGRLNEKAATLSRLPLPEMPHLLMNQMNGTPVTSVQIKDWTKRDPVLSQVYGLPLKAGLHHVTVRP